MERRRARGRRDGYLARRRCSVAATPATRRAAPSRCQPAKAPAHRVHGQSLHEARAAPRRRAGCAWRCLRAFDRGPFQVLAYLAADLFAPHGAALRRGRPGEAELRIAQAQLVGWLEGLFHGIQATLMSQQMAAWAQLEGYAPAGPAPGGGDGPDGAYL